MLENTYQRISQTAQRCVCVSSSLVNRCGVSYTQEYSIHGCQSGTWSQSGMKVKRVTLCHGGNPLLKQTGIRVATKPFPGPTTREHRELVSIKTISCGTSSSFYCLECVCASVFVCCHPIYSGCQVCGRTNRVHTGEMSYRVSTPSSELPAFQNLSNKIQKRLSDMLPIYKIKAF